MSRPTPLCPMTFGPQVINETDEGLWKHTPEARACIGSRCAWWCDAPVTENHGVCGRSVNESAGTTPWPDPNRKENG